LENAAAPPICATARKFWQKVIFVLKMVKKTQPAQFFTFRLSSEADHRPFSLFQFKIIAAPLPDGSLRACCATGPWQ
jgi:hypothetical protein